MSNALQRSLVVLAASALLAQFAHGQSFTARPLSVSITNPTSLQFGPDGRLYVSEQYGRLYAFSVERTPGGDYQTTATETIDLIRQIANHDDDGSACSADCNRRQVTGLLVSGSASQPVLLVSSSDPRVSVANDSGLDTNSGMLTRLTCTGGIAASQCQGWTRVDLVRGLPRSEENHASNGLSLDELSNTLYMAAGGNSNKGAPSTSFSGTTEYFFAGAILSIDLDALAAIESANGGPFIDARDGSAFIHDLLTLDDPDRANIFAGDPGFPYQPGHPWHGLGVDPGDPFGGNNGFNQAIPVPGGPVQVHSPGYRNAFDVLWTVSGDLYTWDNGPNSGWGGTPIIRDINGVRKGYSTEPGVIYDPTAGDYCSNEMNESGSATIGDSLQRISGPGYYGGHPAPIRAFPDRSGIHRYTQVVAGGSWSQVLPLRRLGELLPVGYGVSLADYPGDPRQCDYRVPANALEIVSDSTNGLAEYRAANFDGAMQGDLLAASFNGNIYRCKPDGSGGLVNLPGSASGTNLGMCEVLLSGFGSMPLDVTTQGNNDVFPGTIWAATYGASSITVFEPADFVCDPSVPTEDSDFDGYSNVDETDNGTDPCSAGSIPNDWDGDFISDLNDPDDDNDGSLDVVDVFALDPDNGLLTELPLFYPLFNNDPNTGLFGLGFTGLMLPLDGTTSWLQLYEPTQLAAGGAAGLLTVETVQPGLSNGFMFGVNADTGTPPFVASTRLMPPWFEVGGSASPPLASQFYGLFLGNGDQDNYLMIALAGNGNGQIRVDLRVAGVLSTASFGPEHWDGSELLDAASIELFLQLDPQSGAVQPRLSLDSGATLHSIGPTWVIPLAWLSPDDDRGLAIGAISSSGQSGNSFGATWDHFRLAHVTGSGAGEWNLVDAFDEIRHEGGFVQAGLDFHLIGGRESNQVRSYSLSTRQWRSGAASPIKLHHMQAVVLDGLIYVIGAMTGECCAEPAAPRVYIYDPLADRWTTGPALPVDRLRGGGGAAVVDGKIYQVSGNTNGHFGPVSALVDVYDPATGSFDSLSPIPNPRDHFFVGVHEGRIVAAAGRDSNAGEDGDVFDDVIGPVDVYDIASDSWSTLPAAADLPTLRAAAATAIIGNELIVAGGESSLLTSAHPETEALDLTLYNWRSLSPMRTPRHATQAIVSEQGLYVAAGSSQRGGPNSTPLPLEALHLFGSTEPTGTAITAGSILAPTAVDFGTVAPGNVVLRQVELSHGGGNQAVIVDGLLLAGSPDYRLLSPQQLPLVLAPGAVLVLQLEYAPLAQGSSVATLDIASPGRDPIRITLTGEAVSGTDPLFSDGFETLP